MNFGVRARVSIRLALRHGNVRSLAVVTAIAVLLTAIVGFGYWWPAARNYTKVANALNAKRHALIDAMREAEVATAYARGAKSIDGVERKLKVVNAQVVLLDSLAVLAKKQGVKIVSQAYEEGKAQNGYIPLHLELNLLGPYPAVRHFLTGIEALPTFTRIEEATLSAQNEGGGHLIAARLRLITNHSGAGAGHGA